MKGGFNDRPQPPSDYKKNPYTVIFWDDRDHQMVSVPIWARDTYTAVLKVGDIHFNYEYFEPSEFQLMCVMFGIHDMCLVESDLTRFTWFPS